MNFLFLHNHPEIAVTKITNTATAKARGLAPITAKATFFVKKKFSDLMVTQTTNKPIVYEGENLTYTIVVTNKGRSNATKVILTDVLPRNSDLVSIILSKGNYSSCDHLINCKLGKLASGDSITITITITPKFPEIIVNFARVIAKQYDPNLDNNTSTKTTTVKPL